MKKAILIVIMSAVLAVPSFAGTKEQLIQLQTQMQDLQDQMHRMQQSFDERMGVMRNLVEQTTDSVNKMNASVANLDKTLHAQTGESTTKVDQVSTQVQALQDSVDELKARMAKMSKQLEDMQAGQQNLTAPPAGAPGAQSQAPPPEVLYNNALRDYNAGKMDLASGEFGDYLKFYPTTDLAGNAQFYVADILYRGGNYQQAATEFDKVLEQYPGGNKTATAQLRKGESLLQLGQRDSAIKEFRSVVARYPKSPESGVAASHLRKLGAAASAGKPSAARPR
jgi:tol-pal system protein YbgF